MQNEEQKHKYIKLKHETMIFNEENTTK